LTPLREITSETSTAAAHLFGIAPVARYLPIQSRGGGRGRRASTGAGENPAGGATIDYLLKSPAGVTTLTILDAHGQQVRQFSSNAKGPAALPASTGVNRFVWDLRYMGAREVARPEAFVSAEFSRTQAPIAPPGRYTVRLSTGGRDYEQPLEIVRDPRVTATDQDLVAQFDLMVRIRNRVSEITDLVERVRTMRQDLSSRALAGANSAKAESVRQTLHAIENTLTRLQGPNPNTFPPKGINDRLGALSGAVAQADARPTRQMVSVFDELSAVVAREAQRLEEAARTLSALTSADRR
jgi:hypothetical protein